MSCLIRQCFNQQCFNYLWKIPNLPRHPVLVVRRNVHRTSKKRTFTPRHKWDRIPQEFKLIYESNLRYWIGSFRIGVTTSGLLASVMIGSQLQNVLDRFSTTEIQIFGIFVLLFLFAVALTNIIARSFFTRVYYHTSSGEFIAVRRKFTGRLEQLNYKLEDIHFPGKSVKNAHEGAEVIIKGRKVNINALDFVSTSFYNMHLGSHHDPSQKSYFKGPTL